MKIAVVGFDPSLSNWGVARANVETDTGAVTIRNLNIIKTKPGEGGKTVRKSSEDLDRATLLYEGMTIACYGMSIAIAEVPSGAQSARGGMSNGICIGVLAGVPIPLIQVSQTEVKMAAIGKKNATKMEMIEWAMELHPCADLMRDSWRMRKSQGRMVPLDENEHIADAIATIYAGIKTEQFRAVLAIMKSVATKTPEAVPA